MISIESYWPDCKSFEAEWILNYRERSASVGGA
jgi:hypothetical protein